MLKNNHLIKIVLLFTVFLFLSVKGIHAQGFIYDPGDTILLKSAESFDFKGKFVVRYANDEKNRYYLADFSKFSGRFEKVFFMNQVFTEQRIVNIDGDISKNQVWFLASIIYPESDIVALFEQLKKETEEKARGMSQAEMEWWLKQNDKYKQIVKP